MAPGLDPLTPDIDPMVLDAVNSVRDRFGAEGLRDLIARATAELGRVEQAERDLARLTTEQEAAPAGSDVRYDSADTQAWLAYTEAEARGDDDLR